MRLPYWNHNAAYYPWIRRQLRGCGSILDVGCGEGTLARFLSAPGRHILALEQNEAALALAAPAPGVEYRQGDFLRTPLPEAGFDAVVFVASLHHMPLEPALKRAKALLRPGGRLLLVALTAPDTPGAWLLDLLRLLPARLGGFLYRRRAADPPVPRCGDYPPRRAFRRQLRALLPGVRLRSGLYWREKALWQA